MYNNPESVFGGEKPLLGLIERIYSGVEDATQWPEIMQQIATVIQAESIGLFANFHSPDIPSILGLTGFDLSVWDDFANYYASINPVMKRCETLLPPESTWMSHLVMTDSELSRTECYADFYRVHDMQYFAGIRIFMDNQPHANLSCQRSKSLGPFDERADIILQTLKPHLRRALTLHTQFHHLQSKNQAFQNALDAYDHAVVCLNAKGVILGANSLAESLLHPGNGLRVYLGRLYALDPGCDRLLQQSIHACLQSELLQNSDAESSFQIHRRDEKPSLQVTVSPYRGQHNPGIASVRVMVYLNDPDKQPRRRDALLRDIYGLTKAESRIADLLAQGLNTNEISEQTSITLETARVHVKRILNKTGSGRQANLIRMISSLPGNKDDL